MECNDVRKRFSEYLDSACSAEIKQSIDQHLAECADCRGEFAAYRAFADAFAGLPREELPFAFQADLVERIAEEHQHRNRRRQPLYRRTWVRAVAGCACLMLLIGLCSAGLNLPGRLYDLADKAESPAAVMVTSGGSGYNSYDSGEGYALEEKAAYANLEENDAVEAPAEKEMMLATGAEMDIAVADDQAAVDVTLERKIIKDWYIMLMVDDYDSAVAVIEQIANDYGGYVVSGCTNDNSYAYSREGNISIRVDASLADAAVAEIGALGKVDSSRFSSSDVTAEYYDVQSRLKQYRTQEERLLALYEQAETIDELISLEAELTRVQSEIDSLTGTIRYYDQLTALSLIDVNLYTPSSYTQTIEPQGWDGFFSRLGEGFLRGANGLLDFMADAVVFIVSILPALIVLAVLIVIIVFAVRANRKKSRDKIK